MNPFLQVTAQSLIFVNLFLGFAVLFAATIAIWLSLPHLVADVVPEAGTPIYLWSSD